jgi:hypothetical protein
MDNEAQGTINRRVAMQIKRRVSGWLTLAVFAVGGAMVASDPAFAKVDVDQLTIGGEARIRYEGRNNAALNSNTKANESAASHRIRVNVAYDLTPDVSFFAQFQDARVYGSEHTGAVSGSIGAVSGANQNSTGVDLHQGYILVKNLGLPGLSLKIGRQEIMYGDHRLFGNFNWSQIGNAFDAVKLGYYSSVYDVDLFWARIAETEATSASGVIFPATAGTKGTDDQNIYGLYVTLKMVPNWTVEPYYFLLQDTRPAVATALTTPQSPAQTRSTLGGRINGKVGPLDATGELAWQMGGMSNVAGVQDHNLHINAWAGAFKAGYTFDAVPMRPRVGLEFDYASGSNKTTPGGKNNTFDNLFPTNHFKFGAMDLNAWRNSVVYQLVFDVKPDAVSKVQVNFIIHRLASTKDNWYRTAQGVYGTSAATNQAASLGRELDIHYYRTIKEKFKFEIGVGHFWAGEWTAAAGNTIATADPNGSGQNWGYMMGSVLF